MPLSREAIEPLEAMQPAELRAWTSQFIATGDPSPLGLVFAGRSALDSFIVFVRDLLPDDSYRLRDRLQTAVAELAGSVAPDEDSRFDYLWEVITAATRLKAYHLRKVIIPKINGGEFRGKQGHSEDLHCCFIEALTDLGLRKNEVSILRRRDISDPRYSTAAYRALYMADPEWALKHFPLVADAIWRSHEDPISEMVFVLEDLVDVLDEHFVTDHLATFVLECTRDQRSVDLFFDALPDVFPNEGDDVYNHIVDQLLGDRWDIQLWEPPIGAQFASQDVVALFTPFGGRTAVSQCQRLIARLMESGVCRRRPFPQTLNAVKRALDELEDGPYVQQTV